MSGAVSTMHQSDAEAVREFTAGAGQPTPEVPVAMSREEVHFIGKMMLDEIMELFATVSAPEEAKATLKSFIVNSKDIPKMVYEKGDVVSIVADQADALVDSYYYSLNAAAKKGFNMSAVFKLVHGANMAKRDPVSGEFLKRADGKIIKPAGWTAPDVRAEIARQMSYGAWKKDGSGHQSDAEAVREFTAGAGQPTPDVPGPMSKEEVNFIGKMMLDEIMELFATTDGPAEAKKALTSFIDNSKDIALLHFEDGDIAGLISEQADALVDAYYYSLNAAAKKGFNMSAVFQLVHGANMAKRDPATGKFIKRADGKILKPAGWTAPDVNAEIARQLAEGAWSVAPKGGAENAPIN